MDLNQLYHDHQVQLISACAAGPGKTRQLHEADARGLAARIVTVQERSGARAAGDWRPKSVKPGAAMSTALTARGFVA